MNIKISKKILQDALSNVSRAILPNSPVPAMQGILLSAIDSKLVLIASSSNISIKIELSNSLNEDCNLTIMQEGRILMDARYLNEVVRKSDGNTINLEIIDGQLVKIFTDATEYKINGLNPNDYPTIDFENRESKSFKLNSANFTKLVNSTVFATAESEVRPELTGLHLSFNNNSLKAVATDSFRLSQNEIEIESDIDLEVNVPKKALIEITRIFVGSELLDVKLSQSMIQFSNENTLVQSRLIEGEYPKTDRLIPTNFILQMDFDKRVLQNSIDRSLFIKSDGINIVKLNYEGDDLSIKSDSNEVGSSYQDLPFLKAEGSNLKIAFSGNYVEDALKVINSTTVSLNFSGELTAFVIKNEKEPKELHLILPYRVYD